MKITRREHCQSLVLAPSLGLALDVQSGWTGEWDRAVIEQAVQRYADAFDPRKSMLTRRVGSEYRYHTNMRDRDVHPTRESFDYALLLLETGDKQYLARVHQIIERTVSLQETDPGSKWYGLWGYYLEEPAPLMAPADWN
ncbi:MAG: hypothetical protein ACRD7E_12095, partial [Bryobacteraceae bacterium]